MDYLNIWSWTQTSDDASQSHSEVIVWRPDTNEQYFPLWILSPCIYISIISCKWQICVWVILHQIPVFVPCQWKMCTLFFPFHPSSSFLIQQQASGVCVETTIALNSKARLLFSGPIECERVDYKFSWWHWSVPILGFRCGSRCWSFGLWLHFHWDFRAKSSSNYSLDQS